MMDKEKQTDVSAFMRRKVETFYTSCISVRDFCMDKLYTLFVFSPDDFCYRTLQQKDLSSIT